MNKSILNPLLVALLMFSLWGCGEEEDVTLSNTQESADWFGGGPSGPASDNCIDLDELYDSGWFFGLFGAEECTNDYCLLDDPLDRFYLGRDNGIRYTTEYKIISIYDDNTWYIPLDFEPDLLYGFNVVLEKAWDHGDYISNEKYLNSDELAMCYEPELHRIVVLEEPDYGFPPGSSDRFTLRAQYVTLEE